MARRHFDWKQVFFSLIGVAFAVGIVFLIITHIGQQVSRSADDSPHSEELEASGLASSAATGATVNNADYQFFELLEAPAPERDLPTLSLATNPAIEARRKAKLARRAKAREARRKAREKVASRDEKREEAAAPTRPEPKPSTPVVAAAETREAPAPKPAPEAKPEEPRVEAPHPAVVATTALNDPATQPKAQPRKGAEQEAAAEPSREDAEKAKKAKETAEKAEKAKKAKEKAEKAKIAKAKAEKAKKAKAKAKKRKAFTVQVSAFKDSKAAESLASDLKSQGYRAHVKREEVPGKGSWYRVRVGRFSSRGDAKSFQKKIADKQGLPGFVTNY